LALSSKLHIVITNKVLNIFSSDQFIMDNEIKYILGYEFVSSAWNIEADVLFRGSSSESARVVRKVCSETVL
jgi:predicted RNA-binding protein with PUA domain